MEVTPIQGSRSRNVSTPIAFKRLLPQEIMPKIAFLDVDETLINWAENLPKEEAQKIRNRLFDHLRSNKILSVYSSDRGYSGIMPLVEDGTLANPDYIVGNNGGYIYKGTNGRFDEIQTYSAEILQNFDKNKLRQVMAEIANRPENMFSEEEWAKLPPELIPEGQKEFRRSKITEYISQESPINIRFVLAPGMYEQNIKRIQETLTCHGINANITVFHYPAKNLTKEGLSKYISEKFTKKLADDMFKHYVPRSYTDGSADAILISATDKGMASEYIRKSLGFEKSEVFASGDGENDFGHANKDYWFGLISNASNGLRKLITANSSSGKVIESTKPGVEGIMDILV